MKQLIFFSVLFTTLHLNIFSQCSFTATVTPNNLILCNTDTAFLTTQVYDSYQWYKDGTLMPGETNQTLMVTGANDAGSQFYVEATLAACAENSDTVLVDGWAFLPPYVITNTTPVMYGGSGEAYYCAGTTVELELGIPYDTNITWYESGTPIAGETDPIIHITQTGNYTVSGAPNVCPNTILYLGVTIPIIILPPFEPDWPDWDNISNYVFFTHSCANAEQCYFYYVDTTNNGAAVVDSGLVYNFFTTGTLDQLQIFTEYRVECYDSLGCIGTDTIEVYVESIEENPLLQLNVFPNPAIDIIQLFLQDDMENYQVRFIDVHGRIVHQQRMMNAIDISFLSSGIYTVEVFSNQYFVRKRMIKS
jgi:hypothetical protein